MLLLLASAVGNPLRSHTAGGIQYFRNRRQVRVFPTGVGMNRLSPLEQQRRASRTAPSSGGEPDRSTMDKSDDYIRGVETFEDPYSGESRRDSNYQHHWTDGLGTYRQNNDPGSIPTSPFLGAGRG